MDSRDRQDDAHGPKGERGVGDAVDEAWLARCLLRSQRSATLATSSAGQPFASLVTPAVSQDGSILMLLSSMATHSRHLAAEPRCALMVEGTPTDLNPQTAPRLTVTGTAEPVVEAEYPNTRPLRAYWLARHPYARLYADFADFSLWRVVPQAGLFIGGFARATNLSIADLTPPAEAAAAMLDAEERILAHCNDDHADALARLAATRGASGRWRMIGVDSDGFDLVQDESVLRVPFDMPVADPAGVRAALVRMIEASKHRW